MSRTRWLALVLLAGPVLPAPAADGPDPAAVDRYVYSSLRHVINHGVDLYNAGNVDDCYLHFRKTLEQLVPVLAHHPDLQKVIQSGLSDVESNADWRVKMAAKGGLPSADLAPANRQRAFALRAVFNEVRAGLSSDRAAPPAAPPDAPRAATATLWERLGGDKSVVRIVDDFTKSALADPKVNFDRDGKVKLDALAVDQFKTRLADMISAAAGGPRRYTGKSMRDAHLGMGITDAEFDAFARHLKTALEKNAVAAADAAAVLKAVEATRKDIVEPAVASPKPAPGDGKPAAPKPGAGSSLESPPPPLAAPPPVAPPTPATAREKIAVPPREDRPPAEPPPVDPPVPDEGR